MKRTTLKKSPFLHSCDKSSENLLIEKMGMSKKELREVSQLYGVPPSKLLELMLFSKYRFVYQEDLQNRCAPCHRITPVKAAV